MLDLGGTAETETCHYNSNSLAGVHADGIVMKPHPSRGQRAAAPAALCPSRLRMRVVLSAAVRTLVWCCTRVRLLGKSGVGLTPWGGNRASPGVALPVAQPDSLPEAPSPAGQAGP
jgi:hypothetical protein